uniref:Ufd2P_core domain-containing protein n=1 Tax=Macrostomum lignano TaxID=282301 RepID=A0A1I8FND0_9PLAT
VVAKTTASWPAPACSSAACLHDSLTVVSLEDDRRRYASLICAFVSSLDFGSGFSTAAFGHLEPVLAHLIRLVNGLAARTLAVVHGRHTARTSAFTHACAAFSFVTLPSLDEPGLRCQLYLESAQVALLNQCYGQADALLKEAIRLLLQLLAKPHQQLQQPLPPQLHPLLSSLVLFPDDPDSKQPLTLLTGPGQRLVRFTASGCNGLAESAQQQSIASRRPECIVPVLVTIATMSQDKYPYRVEGVSANDVLLAGSQKARSHLADLSGQLMRHLLIELDNLATAPTGQQAQQQHQRRRLRDLRLGLLCGLADHCDLTAPDTARPLWQLTAASIDGGGDVQQARAALAQLRDRARGVAGGGGRDSGNRVTFGM